MLLLQNYKMQLASSTIDPEEMREAIEYFNGVQGDKNQMGDMFGSGVYVYMRIRAPILPCILLRIECAK